MRHCTNCSFIVQCNYGHFDKYNVDKLIVPCKTIIRHQKYTRGIEMAPILDRRQFLAFAGSAGAVAGLGHTGFLSSARAAGTLTVTHFGGPYAILSDLVARPFAAAGLGEVAYEQEVSTSALGKMQAGTAAFDVAMMSRSPALRAINAGLLQTFNPADVPNLADSIDGVLLRDGFGAGFIMDSLDLMVDTNQVPEPLTSWLDLWRPDLAGKIALPAARVQTQSYLLPMVALAMGGDYKDDEAIDAAFAKFAELKPNVRVFYGDPGQASAMLERGEVAVAPQYSIRISSLMKNNAHIVRATPEEGVAASPYDLVIAKTAQDPALAAKYIDFILSADVQKALATEFLALPVNKTVELDADVAAKTMTDASKLNFLDEEYLASKQSEWLTRWEREIQAD